MKSSLENKDFFILRSAPFACVTKDVSPGPPFCGSHLTARKSTSPTMRGGGQKRETHPMGITLHLKRGAEADLRREAKDGFAAADLLRYAR